MVNISDGSYPAAAEKLFIYELLLAFSNITDLTSSFSSSLTAYNYSNWTTLIIGVRIMVIIHIFLI